MIAFLTHILSHAKHRDLAKQLALCLLFERHDGERPGLSAKHERDYDTNPYSESGYDHDF